MSFIEKLKNFFTFTQQISDEEFDKLIEENNAILCPNCKTYIGEQDLIDNEYYCPRCHAKIEKSR